MDSAPAFLSIIATGSNKNLRIPIAFYLHIQNMSKKVTLRDCHKKLWSVEVVERKGKWYFEKGWERFCQDLSAEPGDIFVFEYKGENLFHFQLFGETACEKNRIHVKEEEIEDKEEVAMEEEEEEFDDDDDQDLEVKEEQIEEKEEVAMDEEEEEFDADDDDDDDEDYVEVKEENEEEVGALIVRSTSRRGHKVGDGMFSTKRRSGKSKNPSFVSRSRLAGTRRNSLNIPKDVVRDWNIEIPEKVFLVDEEGRQWGTQVKKWGDGRLWCSSKGWKSLCKVNGIGADDPCICELDQRASGLYIRVRLARGPG